MTDESKSLESLGKILERLEKVLERVEKRLDTLDTPAKEVAGEEREKEDEKEAERAERRAEREAERVAKEAEREAERAEKRAEGAGERFPFGSGEGFEKQLEHMGEDIGKHMEHVGRDLERHFERRFGSERPAKTEEFKFGDFSAIEIGGIFDIEIDKSDTYSISITADEDLFKNLSVEKKGEKLEISHARHISWWSRLTRPRVKITLPVLKGLQLSGASWATFKGFSSTEDFKMELSGASRVSGEITAGNAKFEVSGASNAELTGSAKDIVIEASGANRLDLSKFAARNIAVKLTGAVRCAINLDGRLDARLSGASRLDYTGNAVMGDIRTSGASRLNRE